MSVIPAATLQLVLVTTADWASTTGAMQRWERTPGGPWQAVGAPAPAVVGKRGLGWGLGLHPTLLAGPVKAEGDGRAPAGVFTLGPAFGKAPDAPVGTRLGYAPVAGRLCVDDPGSSAYNQIVEPGRPVDWRSAETLARKDWLYDWLVVAGHNPQATPAAGSCIFVHVWRAADKPTVGCTAAAAEQVEGLIRWLDPAAAPVLVQLPAAELALRRGEWGLP